MESIKWVNGIVYFGNLLSATLSISLMMSSWRKKRFHYILNRSNGTKSQTRFKIHKNQTCSPNFVIDVDKTTQCFLSTNSKYAQLTSNPSETHSNIPLPNCLISILGNEGNPILSSAAREVLFHCAIKGTRRGVNARQLTTALINGCGAIVIWMGVRRPLAEEGGSHYLLRFTADARGGWCCLANFGGFRLVEVLVCDCRLHRVWSFGILDFFSFCFVVALTLNFCGDVYKVMLKKYMKIK